MTLDQAITDAAEHGARKALAAHVPRLALTVNEVARATGAGVTTVRRWITDGHLARVPHTDRVLIPVASLEAFVTSACASTSAAPLAAGVDGRTDTDADGPTRPKAPPIRLTRPSGDRRPTSTAGGPARPPAA